jgi:hypothetical protein
VHRRPRRLRDLGDGAVDALVGAIVTENSMPSDSTARTTCLLPDALSPRTIIFAPAPHARACPPPL